MSTLELTTGRLSIDGTPSVLLCSSVFPFRIPSQQWEHRLRLVRESGYRMIDLYVHWGFHEEVEGQIDLSSPERDLQRFLDLAHDQRSEEHTSELQSRGHLVCRLLLEKKK